MSTTKKYKLTVITRDRRYPNDEIGGKVRFDKPPPGYGAKWEDALVIYEVPGGDYVLLFGTPTKSDRCMYEPESGMESVIVNKDMTYTGYYKCTDARTAVSRLQGSYSMKREDYPSPRIIDFHFEVNADFCLFGTCTAADFSGAEGFAHMTTEPGNHGWKPHRGDYMDSNRPLTAGFFQGICHGRRPGNQGSFRFKLALQPVETGQVIPMWYGYLTFKEGDQLINIQTVCTRSQPVWWTNRPPA